MKVLDNPGGITFVVTTTTSGSVSVLGLAGGKVSVASPPISLFHAVLPSVLLERILSPHLMINSFTSSILNCLILLKSRLESLKSIASLHPSGKSWTTA